MLNKTEEALVLGNFSKKVTIAQIKNQKAILKLLADLKSEDQFIYGIVIHMLFHTQDVSWSDMASALSIVLLITSKKLQETT